MAEEPDLDDLQRRMDGAFDVQRDHPELVRAAMAVLRLAEARLSRA